MQQSSRRGRNLLEADRHSLEFTSGQLVLAICGLLLLWLAGFVMGVAADRVSFGSDRAALAAKATPEEMKAPAEEPKPKAKDQTAKRTAAPAPNKPAAAPKPAAKTVEAPKKTTVPAPAPAAAPAAKQPVATAKADTAGGQKFLSDVPSPAATRTQAEAPAPAPAKEKVPVSLAPIEPPEDPSTPPADAKPAPDKKAEPAEAAVVAKAPEAKPAETKEPEPKNEKGNFTIQIISYKVSNKKMADDFVKRLKSSAGLDASLVKSKDGKTYQVVYGSYKDRASAEKAQAELKKKPEFADCIVRER